MGSSLVTSDGAEDFLVGTVGTADFAEGSLVELLGTEVPEGSLVRLVGTAASLVEAVD